MRSYHIDDHRGAGEYSADQRCRKPLRQPQWDGAGWRDSPPRAPNAAGLPDAKAAAGQSTGFLTGLSGGGSAAYSGTW